MNDKEMNDSKDIKEDKRSDNEINEILKLFFNKYSQDGNEKLEELLINKIYSIDYTKLILDKISAEPFIQYLTKDGNSIKIYFFLFKILKKAEINLSDNIYFEIIESIFKINLKELNKVNIIVEIIKGEKIFMIEHFSKLLNKIVIQLLLKGEINKRKEGYYLDQVIKAGIGSLFQKEYNNASINSSIINSNKKSNLEKEISICELNENFNRIYYYLINRIKKENKQEINILIISWFNFLESLPGKDLTNHYYEIITKLLIIIKSDNKEESELGELYLKKIIKNIISSYNEKELDYIKDIVELIIKSGSNQNNINDNNLKLILFELLNSFLEKFEFILDNEKNNEQLIQKIPFELFPEILNFILVTIINLDKSSQTIETNDKLNMNPILKSNLIFSNLMKKVKPKYFINKNVENEISTFENVINIDLLNNLNEKSTNLVFDWISQLYISELFRNDEFLKNLIITMKNLKEYHLKRIIGVMHMIKVNSAEFNKEIIINKILKKFDNKEFVEKFGFYILNELSDESNKTMDLIEIFKEIAKYLDSNSDIIFNSNIIDMLTEYLIEEKKANKVLEALNSDKKFFSIIYKVFCFNPFDTLVLLLLAKHFELSYFFVLNLSRMELESSDLIELSKAVQVFESFYFIDVRIQLLNPKSNIYLTKTLYAISLLLPPGPALDALTYRLKCLEMLYDFDEEKKEKNFEHENNYDINNDDSSKTISECEEFNSSSNITEEKNFSELLNYMDENEKELFQKDIKDYIFIFELQIIKIKNFMRKFKIKNRSFRQINT